MDNYKSSTTSKSWPLIFFGNERLSTGFTLQGAPTLEALLQAGYPICAVVSHYEAGRSRANRPLEIAEVAKAHSIPLFLPSRLSDISAELEAFNAVAGILVAYGKIVPQSVIDLFPQGIINIHPSLLPHYRGPTPIEQAILDGISTTGVSLMQLAKDMDAGPLFAQQTMPLQSNETKQALSERLLALGGRLLLEHLPAILGGSLLPTPQDNTKATYCNLLRKQDGVLDWGKPAEHLAREIRAFAVWPQSTGTFHGTRQHTRKPLSLTAIITQATPSTEKNLPPLPQGTAAALDNRLFVGTSTTPLEITSLKIPGKKEISAAQCITGYQLGQ